MAAVDQLGDLDGGSIGHAGSVVLAALLGLLLGAMAGGFLAKITAGNENTWTGRGAIVGALVLAAIAS